VTQHASLSPDRWAAFGLDQQILMVANEMNRGRSLMKREDAERLRNSYERVLRLVDLTVEVQRARGLRKELLRFREVVGGLYLQDEDRSAAHGAALRALLLMTPRAAAQIPFLLR
jgi:hypothetical protein